MDARVEAIRAGRAAELVWLLEHPPLYTAGTSADATDLLQPDRFPVYRTGRGGQYTYHGPGQRVAYVMLDLSKRRPDVRWYVKNLEDWLICALDTLGVEATRREGQPGVWVAHPAGTQTTAKIAALGVRVRRWVTLHGISLNVAPDLGHFAGIVPCGVMDAGVTSLADLGAETDPAAVDTALRAAFERVFACRPILAPPPATAETITPGLP
jgi:lipoyl(octanoyl) transferase